MTVFSGSLDLLFMGQGAPVISRNPRNGHSLSWIRITRYCMHIRDEPSCQPSSVICRVLKTLSCMSVVTSEPAYWSCLGVGQEGSFQIISYTPRAGDDIAHSRILLHCGLRRPYGEQRPQEGMDEKECHEGNQSCAERDTAR